MNQSIRNNRKRRRKSRMGYGILHKQLDKIGWRSALVPHRRLNDLHDEIEGRQRRREFAPELYQERYTLFDFDVTTAQTGARSILIIAVFQPHMLLTVTINGRHIPVVIPPTYSTLIDREVENFLETTFETTGSFFFRSLLPLKLLAVRSGLAKYGRNNLAYIDNMGSYCRLLGFYTDLEADYSPRVDPQSIPECEYCVACIKKCPTGAIDRSHFLIHAECCLTFHNERQVNFPDNLKAEIHHCLVGCLYCQSFCPVNRKIAGWTKPSGNLNTRDTEILLEGGPAESLSDSGFQILEEFAFTDDLAELGRNLKALLAIPGNIKNALNLIP